MLLKKVFGAIYNAQQKMEELQNKVENFQNKVQDSLDYDLYKIQRDHNLSDEEMEEVKRQKHEYEAQQMDSDDE